MRRSMTFAPTIARYCTLEMRAGSFLEHLCDQGSVLLEAGIFHAISNDA
jgi:hypothetical protein